MTMEKNERDRKKAFLRSYQRYKRGCKALEAAIDELRANVILPARPLTGMPRGGEPAGLETYIDALSRKEIQLEAKRADMIRAFDRVETAIMKMSPGAQRDILLYRYIAGLTWEQMAQKMGYTVRRLTQLHGYALANFRLPENIS